MVSYLVKVFLRFIKDILKFFISVFQLWYNFFKLIFHLGFFIIFGIKLFFQSLHINFHTLFKSDMVPYVLL